jgi:hypothetical protein
MEFCHVVQVNDGISMHTQKPIRVEQRFQATHTLPKQMKRFSNVEPNVLPA